MPVRTGFIFASQSESNRNGDPAGQAFNPYLYAGNNPLAYVDADGEFFFLVPFLVAAAQGAAI